jgi:two-component system LytT family response regulator/two-component system response regulator LytT
VNAVDYLLKPVDRARLEVALQRAPPHLSTIGIWTGARHRERQRRSTGEDRRARDRAAEPAGTIGKRSANGFCSCRQNPLRVAADDSITVVTNQHAGTSNYRTLDELRARLDPAVFWRVSLASRQHQQDQEIVPGSAGTI